MKLQKEKKLDIKGNISNTFALLEFHAYKSINIL